MADQLSSLDMQDAKLVLNKITKTVDDLKAHGLPFLPLYEQFKDVSASFTVKAKELDEKEREIREFGVKLDLREKDIEERLEVLECNERVFEEAFEVKEREIREFGRVVGEECRVLGEKRRVLEEECVGLESRVEGMRGEIEVLEAEKKGVEERERAVEERERVVEVKGRVQDSRGKEMREIGEVLEKRVKEIVDGERLLEEKRKWVEEKCQELEGREKEIDERGKEVELREKEIFERGRMFESKEGVDRKSRVLERIERELDERVKQVESRAKEILEEGRLLKVREEGLDERDKKVESREKEVAERVKEVNVREKEVRIHVKALELKMNELDELQRKLQLKELEIETTVEAFGEELRSKKDQLVAYHKVLGLKEKKVFEQQESLNEQLNALKEKEKEISSSLKALELKEKEMNEVQNSKRLMLAQEEVDATETTEMNAVRLLLDNDCDDRHQSVMVKTEPMGVPLNGHDLTANQVEGRCNVVGSKVVQVKAEPQLESLLVESSNASTFFTEIQLVFRNNEAQAISSYLIEHAEKDDQWREKMLGLGEEIPDLIQSLIAEHKHLQAAMCICEFKMEHVYPPDFLLETHLEHIQKRVKEMINEAGPAARDDAANLEISALKDVLRCISDYKLGSIYSPATLELRITQLVKEVEERKKLVHSLTGKESDNDLASKSEALDSTLEDITDSNPLKKRKTSPTKLIKQKKHPQSVSCGQNIQSRPITQLKTKQQEKKKPTESPVEKKSDRKVEEGEKPTQPLMEKESDHDSKKKADTSESTPTKTSSNNKKKRQASSIESLKQKKHPLSDSLERNIHQSLPITQLGEEVQVEKNTAQSQMDKKSNKKLVEERKKYRTEKMGDHDWEKKAEAVESTPTYTLDSNIEKKQKASSTESVKQNKHPQLDSRERNICQNRPITQLKNVQQRKKPVHSVLKKKNDHDLRNKHSRSLYRSHSLERQIPHNRRQSLRGRGRQYLPYRYRVQQPRASPPSNWPDYHCSTPSDVYVPYDDMGVPYDDIDLPYDNIGVPYDDIDLPYDNIGVPYDDIGTSRYGAVGSYPADFETPTLQRGGQGRRAEWSSNSFAVNSNMYWR